MQLKHNVFLDYYSPRTYWIFYEQFQSHLFNATAQLLSVLRVSLPHLLQSLYGIKGPVTLALLCL